MVGRLINYSIIPVNRARVVTSLMYFRMALSRLVIFHSNDMNDIDHVEMTKLTEEEIKTETIYDPMGDD